MDSRPVRAQCGKGRAVLVCKACEQKFYCDRQCAKDHWKRGGHKDLCAGLQAQQAKLAALGKHGPDPAVWGGGVAAGGGGSLGRGVGGCSIIKQDTGRAGARVSHLHGQRR
jgi:hypothetical protein